MKKLLIKKHSDVLTCREIDTLDVYADNPDKEIYEMAAIMGVSSNTFNIHLKYIRRKLNIKSGKALVAMVKDYVIEEKDKIIKDLMLSAPTPPPINQAKIFRLPAVTKFDSKVIPMSFENRKLKRA